MKHIPHRARQITVWLLIFALGLVGGAALIRLGEAHSPESRKLNLIRETINQKYLYGNAPEINEDWPYSALMSTLGDTYAAYYSPEAMALENTRLSGAYAGIGAAIAELNVTKEKTITDLLPGGPAEQAGLQVGEIILSVDDTLANSKNLDSLILENILGEPGTALALRVKNPKTGQEREISVLRADIHAQTVGFRMLSDRVGYIVVTGFVKSTFPEFKEAVDTLQSQGAQALLLDFRGNPGGALDSARAMADYMLPDNLTINARYMGHTTITYTQDKQGNTQSYLCSDGHSVELPTAILIDRDSASASELFSAALRDNGRALLVGTNSFGKGIVQHLIDLPDNSAIKLTVEAYYTPSGFALHGQGLTPDVAVERDAPLPVRYFISEQMLTDFTEDNQTATALQVLEELKSGKRRILEIAGQGKRTAAPEGFLSQAQAQPCKSSHLPLTLAQIEAALQALSDARLCGLYNHSDRWNSGNQTADTKAEYEREVTVTLDSPTQSYETTRQLLISADPGGDSALHWLMLYSVSAEEAADFFAAFLQSYPDKERQEITDWLAACGEKNTSQAYSGQGFTLEATPVDGLWDILYQAD